MVFARALSSITILALSSKIASSLKEQQSSREFTQPTSLYARACKNSIIEVGKFFFFSRSTQIDSEGDIWLSDGTYYRTLTPILLQYNVASYMSQYASIMISLAVRVNISQSPSKFVHCSNPKIYLL